MKDNWNGYGAEPFEEEHIEMVKYVMEHLTCIPTHMAPTGAGTVQIEFEDEENDIYLEFEIFSDGQMKVFYKNWDTTKVDYMDYRQENRYNYIIYILGFSDVKPDDDSDTPFVRM